MSRVWIWADLHLNHENIIKYENRPFRNSQEMNDHFLKVWKNTVSKRDLIINLGDVCLCGYKDSLKEVIRSCPGRKYLILGNHDRKPLEYWHDVGFEFVSKYPIVFRNKYILSHEPITFKTSLTNIYGHVHGKKLDIPGMCVSVEQIGYKPFLLEKN